MLAAREARRPPLVPRAILGVGASALGARSPALTTRIFGLVNTVVVAVVETSK
jgi:hypothetical protein